MSKRKKLTTKQEAFVFHYADRGSESFGNATKAAELAGYSGNADTLKSIGCENLTKPYIMEAIQARIRESEHKFELKQEMILEELWNNAMLARQQGKIGDSNNALIKLGEHLALFKAGGDISINNYAQPEKITEEAEAKRLQRIKRLADAGDAIVD